MPGNSQETSCKQVLFNHYMLNHGMLFLQPKNFASHDFQHLPSKIIRKMHLTQLQIRVIKNACLLRQQNNLLIKLNNQG